MNEHIKKFFEKYGLPSKVLQSINDRIMSSGEDLTEDQIRDKCKDYEVIAKSFQSEVDSRVTSALEKRTKEKDVDVDPVKKLEDETSKKDEGSETNLLLNAIKQLQSDIHALKSEKVETSLINSATDQLKQLGKNEIEIRGLLHGRKFNSTEELDSFMEFQKEIHSEIVKQEPNGGRPRVSNSTPSKKVFDEGVVKNFFKSN